jgi:hypothetical protein
VKLPSRLLALGWVAGFAAVSFGCGDDTSPSSPLAPSETPAALAGTNALGQLSVLSVIDEPSLGTDTVDLKSTAAAPQTPINNVEVGDLTPTLTATNAQGIFQDGNFSYAFGVYNVTGGGMTLVETGTVAQGAGSTSYQIQMPLENDSSCQWRVRPFLSGAFGPWSEFASFTTPPAIVITPPVPTAPINGVTVTSFRPEFNVTNGDVEGDAGEVIYQIQVATDSAFSNIVAEEGTHLRARGDTNIPLQNDLMPQTHYYWHVRGRNDGQGRTGLLPGVRTVAQVVGDWSPTADFFTPKEVGNAPGKGQCCPPPNRLDIVLAVLGATGTLFKSDVQQFTEKVAECLAVTDGDWGRRLNDSGTVGKDTVAYRVPGTSNPYSVDILQGAVSPEPIPQWSEHGQVGGSWFAVDASRCVLGTVGVG